VSSESDMNPLPATNQPADNPEQILLIGASSDLGLEIIRRLANRNALILAHYHQSLARLDALRQEIPGLNLVPLQADLSRQSELDRLLGEIRPYPALDKIVHVAAPRVEIVRFKDVKWEHFQSYLDVQLRSLVGVLGECLPRMAKRKRGKVVVILSSFTLNIPPMGLSHYVTAKYALLGLIRSLAAEYSSQRINLNAVSPSMMRTAFLEKMPERMVEILADQSPWQRTATPRDVADLVDFLLSEKADYITGANIPVSGGTAF
jgi:3-oxoacyl-[acyl-carrier protein] reductase